MFGLTGVLIALIVLTIVLAGVFLVRPSITVGATGKILAFIGLCVLPTLCIGTGMSFHMQRSQQTAYCISCHSMESHGQSLYVLNTSYIPAQHFQNHLVPPDKACYTCHTDYTMYGPLKDKLKGLTGCGKTRKSCNASAQSASNGACEETISSRITCSATSPQNNECARIIRCGRSARWWTIS